MSEANKELVRRMYDEAWNEGRLDVGDATSDALGRARYYCYLPV